MALVSSRVSGRQPSTPARYCQEQTCRARAPSRAGAASRHDDINRKSNSFLTSTACSVARPAHIEVSMNTIQVLQRRVNHALLAATCLVTICAAQGQAQDRTFKLAYYNIQSGLGARASPGHASSFVRTKLHRPDPADECVGRGNGAAGTDRANRKGSAGSLPWASAKRGLARPPNGSCQCLGEGSVDDANGVAMLTRYGFAGPEIWQQLDTTQNENPADTKWVLRLRVCLDAPCSQTFPVMVAHWLANRGLNPVNRTRFARRSRPSASCSSSAPKATCSSAI